MAAGVVPQSSCSLRQEAPARIISSSAAGREALPLPEKARLTGSASAACSMRARCHGPGVQVVAAVPVAGPVPPPTRVVIPAASASSTCCGQMKWMWLSTPPAVRILPSPAMTSVPGPMMMSTPGCTSGLPALPIRVDAAVQEGDVGLDDAPMVDDQRVGDDGVDRPLGLRGLGLAHAVADHLAAAELDLLAIDGEVALDLGEQIGVGEAHAVAGGRAIHVGIGGARDAGHLQRRPSRRRGTLARPAGRDSGTSVTSRVWPGSNRTAVPAGMSSRWPRAAARSNCSAGLVSAKW